MLPHVERHRTERIGWLRAAVLGANDGILSTASLVVGVAAADSPKTAILVAGMAGLVAGAMSMAAGEYVSVSSQSDTERADRAREERELKEQPEQELEELQGIYIRRGLSPDLARQVAEQMTRHDVLEAHLRDELGLSEVHAARPVQAALASAAAFAVGAALPLLVSVFAPLGTLVWIVSVASILCLAVLGALSAWVGGAPVLRAVMRICFWGVIAMALTAVVGRMFGAVI